MRVSRVSLRPVSADSFPHPQSFDAWYSASKACLSAITALNRGHERSDVYVKEAARLVAKDATKYYKSTLKKGERIEAYQGQRGIAFGIPQYDPVRQEMRRTRTNECKAISMWFARNIFGKKSKLKPKKDIVARIAEGVKALGKIGRKLKGTEAEKFEARINAEKFEARINALLEAYPPRK